MLGDHGGRRSLLHHFTVFIVKYVGFSQKKVVDGKLSMKISKYIFKICRSKKIRQIEVRSIPLSFPDFFRLFAFLRFFA